MKSAYTFTTLRYVPDVAAGEFLNVGVVLLAPGHRYLAARIQPKDERLRKAFPALDGDGHGELMRYLQTAFDGLQARLADQAGSEPMPGDAGLAAARILPKDDSSLQWSPLGSGLSADPAGELARLYERMVASNERLETWDGRSDEDVWSIFEGPLAQANVTPWLRPHRLTAENDEVVFAHAWKNQQWHCLEPLSFDCLDAGDIQDKAHRLLGQMCGLRSAVQDHVLYVLVGEPQHERCRAPAERCLNLLRKNLPLRNEIVREREADAFAREFARKIEAHQQTDRAAEEPRRFGE